MLLRFAKLAGGLRLLIVTAAPLVVSSASLLSARTAAYLVGFGLGSILSIWLPVVLALVSLTGSFTGTESWECQEYRAQMKLIEETNRANYEAWQLLFAAYNEGPYQNYLSALQAISAGAAATCSQYPESESCIVCGGGGIQGITCVSGFCNPRAQCESSEYARLTADLSIPQPPPEPEYLRYTDGCGSETTPDCPPGKKVWLQVLWASPGGNASDAKGCFLIGYSQDSRDLPAEIEYNPYKLPDTFIKQQALNYDSITGTKFSGVDSTKWQDLDSTIGWDKGYWAAEGVDVECRGWRPGWSLKIK